MTTVLTECGPGACCSTMIRGLSKNGALVTPLEQRPDLIPYGNQNSLHGSLGEVATKWGRPVKGQLLSWGDKENAST